jgi:hypothetical protein
MPALHTLNTVVRDRQDEWRRDAAADRRRTDRGTDAAAASAADAPDPSARRWSMAFHGIRRRLLSGPTRP